VSDTHLPIVRRITWESRCGSVTPSASVRRRFSSTSCSAGSKTAGSSAKPAGGEVHRPHDGARRGLDDDGQRDEALVAEDPPLLQRLLPHVADVEAVDVDVADRHRPDDRRLAVDQVDDDAVLGEQDPVGGHAGLLGQRRVRPQVTPLAVHRHEVSRLGHVEQRAQLAGRGVPGDVHPRGLLVHDGGAEPGQPVDDLVDGGLVAGTSEEASTIVSPASMVTWWCSPRAIRPAPTAARPATRC
jgi:hypothetical protein